jgi:chromosome partitioning protein
MMAKVVTVMNMKGGVGKTTVAAHVGGALARYNFGGRRRKVLLIDYDPQFNLSQAYLPPKQYFALEAARRTTLAILLDDDTKLDPYQIQVAGNLKPPAVADLIHQLYSSGDGRLDMIASTLDLMYVALSELGPKMANVEERFYRFIDECRKLYDVVVIDCHPAGSLFTKTALRSSDHVLIPVAPGRYAVRGIGLMTKFIRVPKAHILFNRTSRSWMSDEEITTRGDKNFKPLCINSTLKWYRAFWEPEGGLDFVWDSGKPWSKVALINLKSVCLDLVQAMQL